MALEATLPLSVVNVPNDYFSMAGFEVTLHGRFWVTAEAHSSSGIHSSKISATSMQTSCTPSGSSYSDRLFFDTSIRFFVHQSPLSVLPLGDDRCSYFVLLPLLTPNSP